MTSGKLGHPEFAESVLNEGKTDFVCLGRPLLADPQWANKAQAGQLTSIRPCIGCMAGCQERIHVGRPIGCAVNPLTGRENKWGIRQTSPKKVLIIGGGPGGCESAITAADEGHGVELWEKTGALGGNLLAAGGPALVPESIPGIDKVKVVTAIDVLKKKCFPEGKIVVIGGEVGVETALHLQMFRNEASIIEMPPTILSEPMDAGKVQLFHRMINNAGIGRAPQDILAGDLPDLSQCFIGNPFYRKVLASSYGAALRNSISKL